MRRTVPVRLRRPGRGRHRRGSGRTAHHHEGLRQEGALTSSDYMAAVEDAVVLGCDTVNLSLGAPIPALSPPMKMRRRAPRLWTGLWKSFPESGIIMCVAAGNDGNWADRTRPSASCTPTRPVPTESPAPLLTRTPCLWPAWTTWASCPSMRASSSPPPATPLSRPSRRPQRRAAGVEEPGRGRGRHHLPSGDPSNLFAGKTQTDERIYAASAQDFAGFDFTGKVVLTARETRSCLRIKIRTHRLALPPPSFTISGALNASIEGSTATIPCGGLSMEDAQAIFALCQKNEAGLYTCTPRYQRPPREQRRRREVPTMSDFSSWGHDRRPHHQAEITAPAATSTGQRPVEGNRRL